MPVNVIGLLNVAIDKEEYVVNEHIRLISREFFERQNISMPSNIRFYKTFIVSTDDFGADFDGANVPEEKKGSIPTHFLWAMKLLISEYDIVNSEWFAGESYEQLKQFVVVSNQDSILSTYLSDDWITSFKIDNIVHNINEGTISDIIILYHRIIDLYKAQDKSPDDINLHWLYAYTKFQECCTCPSSKFSVLNITSALEFLLVNTSNESEYRAAYFAALIYSEQFEDRLMCFNFLKWAYSVRDKLSSSSPLDQKLFVDKSQLPENIYKLREILARVLLRTLGLTNREIQDKINGMIFNCPSFM